MSAREARRAIPCSPMDPREMSAFLAVISRREQPLKGDHHYPDAQSSIAMQEAAALTKEVVR